MCQVSWGRKSIVSGRDPTKADNEPNCPSIQVPLALICSPEDEATLQSQFTQLEATEDGIGRHLDALGQGWGEWDLETREEVREDIDCTSPL